MLEESTVFLPRFVCKCSSDFQTCKLQIPPKLFRTEGRESQRCRNPAQRRERTHSEALSVVVPNIRDVFIINCVDGYIGAL